MQINGKFIYLKRINIKDANFIYKLRRKKNIGLYLHKPPISINFQKRWILKNLQNKKVLDFVIYRKKKNKKLGTIAFDKITRLHAEWGRWISQGNIVENIEAVIVLLDYGFNIIGLKNIYSLTNKDNNKVVNFHKNTTAKYEGIIKSLFRINNKKVDAVKFNFNKKRFNNFKRKFSSMIELIQK